VKDEIAGTTHEELPGRVAYFADIIVLFVKLSSIEGRLFDLVFWCSILLLFFS
jgi:hypothetical protein